MCQKNKTYKERKSKKSVVSPTFLSKPWYVKFFEFLWKIDTFLFYFGRCVPWRNNSSVKVAIIYQNVSNNANHDNLKTHYVRVRAAMIWCIVLQKFNQFLRSHKNVYVREQFFRCIDKKRFIYFFPQKIHKYLYTHPNTKDFFLGSH